MSHLIYNLLTTWTLFQKPHIIKLIYNKLYVNLKSVLLVITKQHLVLTVSANTIKLIVFIINL